MTSIHPLPRRFCWTKFGSEAGESVDQILARKEQERVSNGGLFLWGIGNSVAPGIRRLVGLESSPLVIFSPMKSAPKAIDAKPERVVRWREAADLSGVRWPLPAGSIVTSRGGSALKAKRAHYALVCKAEGPLTRGVCTTALPFLSMRNLESGNPLGFSQVTSVVEMKDGDASQGPRYPIGFVAALTYPYFVELTGPELIESGPGPAAGWVSAQPLAATQF